MIKQNKKPKRGRLTPAERVKVLERCESKEQALDELEKLEGKRITWGGLSNSLIRAGLKGAATALKCGPGNTTWGRETRAQRQQEYNRSMGVTADMLGDIARAANAETTEAATYIAALADEERKYLNRRTARSASIGLARDMLFLRSFQERLQLMPTRVVPKGYAETTPTTNVKRAVNLMLSDLHFGAKLDGEELPIGTTAHTETRRFAKVICEAISYKPRYRKDTHLNLLVLGDILEGLLKHNDRDGDTLTDQFVATVHNFVQAIGMLARAYPSVKVWWQSGNHGRNKLEHPGRATSSKWDSFETMIGLAVQYACRDLKNVSWDISKRPYCAVPLFDSFAFATHGDTVLNLGNPGKTLQVERIKTQLDAINASGEYGGPFSVFLAGHVHTGVHLALPAAQLLINPPLVPPNGFARTCGYHRDRCGQWLFESVPGYPVGDARLILVGEAEDSDASLEKYISPLRFSYEV